MPELPEMETYKILLTNQLVGLPIKNVTINREKSINVPAEYFSSQLLNKKITRIERRGKYLLFYLDSGFVLLLHLMLGGLMYIGKEGDSPSRTKQIIIFFQNLHLNFIGLRLGYLHFYSIKDVEEELDKLGPNPISSDFSEEDFLILIKNKRGILKTTLQNQQFLSGIGNCYSDEICFEAKLLPTRKLNELDKNEALELYRSIRTVLHKAILEGGYMELPLYKGDTLTGGYNDKCQVYDRGGETCFRCHFKITKEIISSKKTYFCANCQK